MGQREYNSGHEWVVKVICWELCNKMWQINRTLSPKSRVFANGPEDRGSIPGRVIPKTQKMVIDAALLNTQYYKERIKD